MQHGKVGTKDSTGEDRRHTAKGAALLPPPAPLPAARPGLLPRAPHRRASQRRAAGTGQNQRRYEPGRLQAKRAEGRKRKKKKKYNSRRRADKLLTESRMRTSRRGRLSAELGRSSFPPGCAPSAGAERRADPGAGRAPPARPLAPRPAPREGIGAEPAVHSHPQLTQESCRGGGRRLTLHAARLRSAPGMSSPRHPLLSSPLRPPQLSREGLPRRPRAGEAGRGRAARARSHSNGQTPGLAGGPRPHRPHCSPGTLRCLGPICWPRLCEFGSPGSLGAEVPPVGPGGESPCFVRGCNLPRGPERAEG